MWTFPVSDWSFIITMFVLIVIVADYANLEDPNSETNDLNNILGID
jgi:hypothetical protein